MRKAPRIRNGRRILLAAALALLLLGCASLVVATPPEYKSIPREQRITPPIEESELMRIWVVYIGQGDGILIQLPRSHAYERDNGSEEDSMIEFIDIMIDGGDSRAPMGRFVERLYPEARHTVIEHAIITHHDQDHVYGLVGMLNAERFGVEHIYHNGLASYRRGAPRFTGGEPHLHNGNRAMARIVDGDVLLSEDLIDDLNDAIAKLGEYQGSRAVYRSLIDALIVERQRGSLLAFDRAFVGKGFIAKREADRREELGEISIEILWPLETLRVYGTDWAATINGNSLTFRLRYRDFDMLFTGDHNHYSQEAMIEFYRTHDPQLRVLDCDVFKVPHHGSGKAVEQFYRRDNQHRRPALSVASMGNRGFTNDWRHPAETVIQWLGGPHRVYCTYIKQRGFRWDDLRNHHAIADMVEPHHILIETDGHWFRIVKVGEHHTDLRTPPTVTQTKRGYGTRWVRARGN